jgi:hypothetical protein
MLDQIVRGKSRNGLANLEQLVPDIPKLPDPLMRKFGFFGKANPDDLAHAERIFQAQQLLVEALHRDRAATAIATHGTRVITKGILDEERMVESLPEGSLAQTVGEQMMNVHGQILPAAHVATIQHFVQATLRR